MSTFPLQESSRGGGFGPGAAVTAAAWPSAGWVSAPRLHDMDMSVAARTSVTAIVSVWFEQDLRGIIIKTPLRGEEVLTSL